MLKKAFFLLLLFFASCYKINEKEMEKEIKRNFDNYLKKKNIETQYKFYGIGEGDSTAVYYSFKVILKSKANVTITIPSVGLINLKKGKEKTLKLYALFHYVERKRTGKWYFKKFLNYNDV